MNTLPRMTALAVLTLALLAAPAGPTEAESGHGAGVTVLATGLGSGSGSTIGPDGALYVTQPATGMVSRVDRRTGRVSTFVSGLPAAGVSDVIFRHGTAYVLITLIPDDASDVVGIYRVTGPTSFTLFADLGAFSAANPPTPTTSCRPACRTRSRTSGVASWSPTGITTGSCECRRPAS